MNSVDSEGDVRVLKKEIEMGRAETNRRLDRIESKIDAQSAVPIAVFEEFKKEVKDTYMTKEENRPMKTLFWTIIGTLITGLIGLLFFLLQGQLK